MRLVNIKVWIAKSTWKYCQLSIPKALSVTKL
jgi:hypothetical protein